MPVPANAAVVNLGTVQAQLSNHVGDAGEFGSPQAGSASGYCITYSPNPGDSKTGWVMGGETKL